MTDKTGLNISVFGVGAMGSLFGSRLNSVANVTLFGNWSEQLKTINCDGLTIIETDGSRSQHRLRVTDNLNDMPAADIALILVKSYQTVRAIRQAANNLRPDGIAITLQNGLGNLEKLTEIVGTKQAGLGVTTQGAAVISPGLIRHAGGSDTYLALLPGLEEKLETVSTIFNMAGLETVLVDNADSLIWGKLAINAGINPLTALLEIPNGELVKNETLYRLMSATAKEVAEVAAAQGIRLPFADIAGRTAEISSATSGNRSSMLQDISRSAPTEIEAICGEVVRYGYKLGVPTPINEALLYKVKAKESQQAAHLEVEPFNLPAFAGMVI